MNFTVEIGPEDDGRSIAEVLELPARWRMGTPLRKRKRRSKR